jgi:hypothetical protein
MLALAYGMKIVKSYNISDLALTKMLHLIKTELVDKLNTEQEQNIVELE